MTGAAPRIASRLKSLIYWSAFVPADGKCLMDEVPPPFVELFGQLAEAAGGHGIMLPFEVWQEGFMNGAGEDVQRLVHQLLVPQPLSFFSETVPALDAAAIGAKIRYIFSEDDVALPPGEYGWVPRFPARLGVEPETAPGGHEACFTHPEGLAEAIMAG
jgi:hypothetical protein